MYRFTLLVVFVTLLGGSIVQAASYKKRDGTIVGSILDRWGDPHSHSGNNLEPGADLSGANLAFANLGYADLYSADLANAILYNADLVFANLSGANLANANLGYADLYSADLANAILYNADLREANLAYAYLANANLANADLGYADLDIANLANANLTLAYLASANLDDATFSTGTTLPDGQTVLQHAFDAAGLTAYLLTSEGASSASNLTLVPEPASVLMLLTGLLLLGRVRF